MCYGDGRLAEFKARSQYSPACAYGAVLIDEVRVAADLSMRCTQCEWCSQVFYVRGDSEWCFDALKVVRVSLYRRCTLSWWCSRVL